MDVINFWTIVGFASLVLSLYFGARLVSLTRCLDIEGTENMEALDIWLWAIPTAVFALCQGWLS
jgi:hypothetical protein